MNRRAFIHLAAAATVAAPSKLFAQASDPGVFAVFAPNVIAAQTASYRNMTTGASSHEPLILAFVAYEFADQDDAAAAFPVICAGLERALPELLASLDRPASENRVAQISMGKVADDRFALVNKAQNHPSQTWTAIRVDNQILTSQSVGVTEDLLTFIVSWSEAYVDAFEGDDTSILPRLADLPVGWEVLARKTDITDKVRQEPPATPMATP